MFAAGVYEFQSLIGRLKAKEEIAKQLKERLFQSLIGRLKAQIFFGFSTDEDMFQSLIGRLKANCDLLIKHILLF